EQRTTRYEYDALGRQVRVLYPSVGVYAPGSDNLTVNGATGPAARVETTRALETRTYYDAQGNAVANRDVGGAVSQKVYDALGRVAYEVDALGYLTAYARNAFGEVTGVTRYASATALARPTLASAAQAATRAQVQATLALPAFAPPNARTLVTRYDQAGRVTETVAPSVFSYDSSAAASAQTASVGATTRNRYDAFGQLVQSSALRNAVTDSWATTTHYFDRVGRESATIDALGYLSWRAFDANGNLTELREYAAARAPGSWSVTGYGAVTAPSGEDRVTRYAWDSLNRKTSETRRDVEYTATPGDTRIRGQLTTSFGYDALGNQTRVTDAAGAVTYTYYDALGRVAAIAQPARASTVAGTSLTPLTVYRRDAHGNALVTIEYAGGALSASANTYAAAAPSSDDRATLASYDALGRNTQTTDAAGHSQYLSLDAWGHVAKKWQGVTGGDGVTRTLFELNAYDALGQLTETRTPASTTAAVQGVDPNDLSTIATVTQAQAGVVIAQLEYNAFGELTRKGTQGGRQEYFDYDGAGRMWRSNAGDGVDRISLFDLQGHVTAQISSAGAARANQDIKGFVNAQAAHASPSTRRTD
ncbi:MAG TPA: RHS repeat domain-containing protein, partial [Burkholderiaceae bacterium]|nr:RHS repeat domain-containing protein [Burkholderiaceae bacterium]